MYDVTKITCTFQVLGFCFKQKKVRGYKFKSGKGITIFCTCHEFLRGA
jgi:hypothetical protein